MQTPGHTVTVFGATGFLGRYIVNRLGRIHERQAACANSDWKQQGKDALLLFHSEMIWRSAT